MADSDRSLSDRYSRTGGQTLQPVTHDTFQDPEGLFSGTVAGVDRIHTRLKQCISDRLDIFRLAGDARPSRLKGQVKSTHNGFDGLIRDYPLNRGQHVEDTMVTAAGEDDEPIGLLDHKHQLMGKDIRSESVSGFFQQEFVALGLRQSTIEGCYKGNVIVNEGVIRHKLEAFSIALDYHSIQADVQ